MLSLRSAAWISMKLLHFAVALRTDVPRGQSEVLDCPSGTLLDIESAEYNAGRKFCDVTHVLQDQCQSSRTCTVYAIGSYYKDHDYICVFKRRNTLYKLTVIYNCKVDVISSLTSTLSWSQTDNAEKDFTSTWLSAEFTTYGNHTERTEQVADTINDEQNIIPVIGCVFGLFFICLIIAVLYRRKTKAFEDENVEVLQITSLTGSTHEGLNFPNPQTRAFENNYYDMEPCGIPEATALTHVDDVRVTKTAPENPDCSEYSSIAENLADSLPPSYRNATGNSSQIKEKNSACSTVHCPIQTDLLSESVAIDSVKGVGWNNAKLKPKPEHAYENESIGTVSKKVVSCDLSSREYNERNTYCNTYMDRTNINKPSADGGLRVNLYANINNVNDNTNMYCNTRDYVVSDKCQKNAKYDEVGNTYQKKSKYDDVWDKCQKIAKNDGCDNPKHTYQNVKDEDGCNSCHGYMTMNVSHSHSGDGDNVYVPIMSPTELSGHQTFDDTHYL